MLKSVYCLFIFSSTMKNVEETNKPINLQGFFEHLKNKSLFVGCKNSTLLFLLAFVESVCRSSIHI